MIHAIRLRYRDILAFWVDGVRRIAWLVVLVSIVATGLTGWYAITHVAINTDTSEMLDPTLDYRLQSQAVSDAFPQFSDTLVVVVEADTADRADDAALELARRMRAHPDLFADVHDLEGHPFFRQAGLLYLDEEELSELSDRLAQAQPFLGALWRDRSLAGLLEMLGLAVDELAKGSDGVTLNVAPVLTAVSEVLEGKTRHLSWHDLMRGGAKTDGAAPSRRFIMVQPAMDFSEIQPAEKAMDQVRDLARDLGPDVRILLTGSVALDHEELESVKEGMGMAGLLSMILVILLLLVGLKSARLLVAVTATLIMGLVWTAGFAVAAVPALNLISVAFAVLFIGLSVDFGIHYGLRYKEAINAGHDHAPALQEAARGVGGALTLCAVAAAIGFYSFLPTEYLGLAELGLIAGSGMFIALFANLTVLPALLTLLPLRPTAEEAHWAVSAAPLIRRHAKGVTAGAVLLGGMAATLLPQARFDFDPLNLKDPHTESVSTLMELMADKRSNPYSITILASDLETAQALGARLAPLSTVRETRTLASYAPKDQDAKLEIIETMGMFLLPALSTPPKPTPTPDDLRRAVNTLRSRLDKAIASVDPPEMKRLRDALASQPTDDASLARLSERLLSGLAGRLEVLKASLEAQPVGLKDLPPEIRDREIARDGRARLDVYPREDLRDHEALRRFVEQVRGQVPEATGSPVVILEAGRTVVKAFALAGGVAVGAISLLMALLLDRARDVLLVFAPLALAGLLTAAASVLLGQPFNFANVIVLPLLFGLGVASGIHLVLRAREDPDGVFATSTPRAVVFSALTTIGSFGSIALSSHPGTASMGVLLTVAIALTLVCTLVVLPALMALWPRVRVENGENRP